MPIPAFYFPATTASTSDRLDFGQYSARGFARSTRSMTLGCRVYLVSVPVSDARIISKALGQNEADHEMMVGLLSTTAFRSRIRIAGTTQTRATATGVLSTGTPYDIIIRCEVGADGASVTTRAFLDGSELTSGTFPQLGLSGSLAEVAGTDLWIGNNIGGSKNFEGFLADCFHDNHRWSQRRITEFSRGAPALELVVDPQFVVTPVPGLTEYAARGATSARFIANLAKGGVPRRGFIDPGVTIGLMPAAKRRDFVAVPLMDYVETAAAGGGGAEGAAMYHHMRNLGVYG